MAKPSKHPGFKELQAEWTRKLKESGFKDIEVQTGHELKLRKSGTERRYEEMSSVAREAKEQFFRKIAQKLEETKVDGQVQFKFLGGQSNNASAFDSYLDYQILFLYSKGIRMAEIKKRLNIKGHRSRVYDPIYKWLKK